MSRAFYSDEEKRAASAAALPHVLQQKKPGSKYWTCPICNHETVYNPGLLPDAGRGFGKWHCVRCGESGDAANVIAIKDGVPVGDAFRRVMAGYGGGNPAICERSVRQREPAISADMAEVSAGQCRRCMAALPGSAGEAYLHGRGFDDVTIRSARLGYTQKCGGGVVIPYSRSLSYFAVRLLKPFRGDNGRLVKMLVPPTVEAGPEPLYNAAALTCATCFAVEGAFDALSIIQAARNGGLSDVNALATCGAVASDKLVQTISAAVAIGACGRVYVAGDNDDAGRNGADSLCAKLAEIPGADFVLVDSDMLFSGCKDANECLQRFGNDGLLDGLKTVLNDGTF